MHDGTFSTAPSCLYDLRYRTIPLLWRGGRHKHFVIPVFSNHVEVLHSVTPLDLLAQVAVLSDGVVVSCLYDLRYRTIPFLWRGGRHKHFVIPVFNHHVEVLHSVTPFDLLAQVAVLSDGVVVSCLYDLRYRTIPFLWRGGRHKHFVMHAFNHHAVVLHSVTPLDLLAQVAVLSDGVVVEVLHKQYPSTAPH